MTPDTVKRKALIIVFTSIIMVAGDTIPDEEKLRII